MSRFEVRYIKEEGDMSHAHIVMEVSATNHNEALLKARKVKAKDAGLSNHRFRSVAVVRDQTSMILFIRVFAIAALSVFEFVGDAQSGEHRLIPAENGEAPQCAFSGDIVPADVA